MLQDFNYHFKRCIESGLWLVDEDEFEEARIVEMVEGVTQTDDYKSSNSSYHDTETNTVSLQRG